MLKGFLSHIIKRFDSGTRWRYLWLQEDKFVVGVSALIFDSQNRLLLLQHRYWRSGSWGLPSGNMKHGEKHFQAIVREVQEETSLIVDPHEVFSITSASKLQVEITMFGFVTGGKISIDKQEILKAEFFELDNLPTEVIGRHKLMIQSFINGTHYKRLMSI